ncbi:putative signal transducing protein [Zavarzinella formosa]|uniref:putative signal transducing protein n=1 Tax=Zavarzinella formosa TaxID=360055 RepID=UPI0002F996CA|nr:DUF2007 domain-containing protein [Zavarzinella formosa]
MAERFVTIQMFENPIAANMAKNRLEAEGVRAFLSDEEVTGINLGNAVGGVRLQTAAGDAERAVRILQSPSEPEDGEPVSEELVVIDRDDPAFDRDDDDRREPELLPTEREKVADRAFRGGILGLIFSPLQFWVFALVVRVYFSNQELRGHYRTKAWVAGWISGIYVLGFCMILRMILWPTSGR